jgi:hypothetical protein
VKNNYGRTGSLLYFVRRHDPTWQVAPLDPVKLAPATRASGIAIETKIAEDLAGLGQLMSKSSYCQRRSGAKGPLGIGEKQMRMHVDLMLVRGQLMEREPTKAERMQHKLSHNIRKVLMPGKLNGARCTDDLFEDASAKQKT